MVVCFQCLMEHIADKDDHFVVVSVVICFCKRNVIFVDEDDDFLVEML